MLNGQSSFHPDGAKRSWRAISSDIGALIDAVRDLPNVLYDPTNISRDVAKDLEDFKDAFDKTAIDNPLDKPRDNIEIPPEHWPGSGRDGIVINPDRDRTRESARRANVIVQNRISDAFGEPAAINQESIGYSRPGIHEIDRARGVGNGARIKIAATRPAVGADDVNVSESSVGDRVRDLHRLIADQHSEYWRSPKADALQQEYRDLIERRKQGELSGRPTESSFLQDASSKVTPDRIQELQRLMGDRHSEYWRGPKADGLQQEYRDLIGLRKNSGLAPGEGDAASENLEYQDSSVVEDRIRELQGLMGDRYSDYWRGPHAEHLQQEYRDLLDRRAGHRARDEDVASLAFLP